MENEDKVLPIKLSYENEQTNKYVNGAFGALSGNGEFILNFYIERPSDPSKGQVTIHKDGTVDNSYDDIGVERIVHTRLVMSIDTARSIQEWIKRNVDAASSQGHSK